MIVDVDGPVRIGRLVQQAREQAASVWLVPAGASKAESLAAFARVLDFPDWFGANLDALADCLDTALHDATRGGARAELIWDGVTTLADADPRAYDAVRQVLDDVAGGREEVTVRVVHRL